MRELSALLDQAALDEMIFAPDFTREDLEAFTLTIAGSLRTTQPTQGHIECGGVVARRKIIEGAVAEQLDEGQTAVWLYESAAALNEGLISRHRRGEALPVLVIQRLARSLVEAVQSESGPFQVIVGLDDLRGRRGPGRLRAAVSIEALSFGAAVGLDAAAMMVLALASWMGNLTGSSNPHVAVTAVLDQGFPDQLRQGVILAIFDARERRSGRRGVSGRMLAVVETYRALVAPGGPELAPDVALEGLRAGRAPGVDPAIAHAFALHKGSPPLGARLELADGQALVVGFDAERRPLIAPLESGRPGRRVSLPEGADPRVLGGPVR